MFRKLHNGDLLYMPYIQINDMETIEDDFYLAFKEISNPLFTYLDDRDEYNPNGFVEVLDEQHTTFRFDVDHLSDEEVKTFLDCMHLCIQDSDTQYVNINGTLFSLSYYVIIRTMERNPHKASVIIFHMFWVSED